MTDQAMVDALNDFADTLNETAATLDAISRLPAIDALRMRGDRHAVPRIEPGSPIARMVEQGKRFAALMPVPSEPTTWDPPASY